MPKGGRISQILEELDRKSEEFYRGMTSAEERELNRHVMGGFAGVHRDPSEVKRLEEIISSAPRTPGPLWVYRGGDRPLPARARANYPIPTTTDPLTARVFATASDPQSERFLEGALVPEGSPGLWLGHPGINPSEKEFLLPRGGEFRSTKKSGETMAWKELEEMLDLLGIDLGEVRKPLPLAKGWQKGDLDEAYQYSPPYKARGGMMRRKRNVRSRRRA